MIAVIDYKQSDFVEVCRELKPDGLDAVFPAALLAIIGNLLRRRSGAMAAAVGGGLCLVLIPIAPAGVPIIASLVGAVVALTTTPEETT